MNEYAQEIAEYEHLQKRGFCPRCKYNDDCYLHQHAFAASTLIFGAKIASNTCMIYKPVDGGFQDEHKTLPENLNQRKQIAVNQYEPA